MDRISPLCRAEWPGIDGNFILPGLCLQQLQQGLNAGLRQGRLEANQVVAFISQGHKVQTGALRRGRNAEPRVCLPGGHGMGHGRVRRFGVCVAWDVGGSQPAWVSSSSSTTACRCPGRDWQAGALARQISQ